MKKTLIVLLCSFLFVRNYAQEINTLVVDSANPSGLQPIKVRDNYISFVYSGVKYISGAVKPAAITLNQYDSAMHTLKSVQLSNGDKVYGNLIANLMTLDGKGYFIYHEVIDGKYMGDVMAVQIDPETLDVGKPKVIIKMDESKDKKSHSGSSPDVRFHICYSPDSTKVLFCLSVGKGSSYITVVDKTMEVEMTQHFADVIVERRNILGYSEHSSWAVDNNGTVYLSSLTNAPENRTPAVKVVRSNQESALIPLKNCGVNAVDIKLIPALSQPVIYVAGTCLDDAGDRSRISRLFCTTININDFSLGSPQIVTVPDSIVEQLANQEWADIKKHRGIHSEQFWARPYEKENGTVELIGEFRRMEIGPNLKHQYFYNGDLLVIDFSKPEGVFTRIPKFRSSTTGISGNTHVLLGTTVYPIFYKNETVILYNDNPENLSREPSKKPLESSNYAHDALVAAIVNEDGKLERRAAVDLSREGYLAFLETAIRLSHRKIVFGMWRIKKLGGVSNENKRAYVEIL